MDTTTLKYLTETSTDIKGITDSLFGKDRITVEVVDDDPCIIVDKYIYLYPTDICVAKGLADNTVIVKGFDIIVGEDHELGSFTYRETRRKIIDVIVDNFFNNIL